MGSLKRQSHSWGQIYIYTQLAQIMVYWSIWKRFVKAMVSEQAIIFA